MQVHDDMNSDGNLPMVEPLTDREMEIPGLISRGLSNREIASELVQQVGGAQSHSSRRPG